MSYGYKPNPGRAILGQGRRPRRANPARRFDINRLNSLSGQFSDSQRGVSTADAMGDYVKRGLPIPDGLKADAARDSNLLAAIQHELAGLPQSQPQQTPTQKLGNRNGVVKEDGTVITLDDLRKKRADEKPTLPASGGKVQTAKSKAKPTGEAIAPGGKRITLDMIRSKRAGKKNTQVNTSKPQFKKYEGQGDLPADFIVFNNDLETAKKQAREARNKAIKEGSTVHDAQRISVPVSNSLVTVSPNKAGNAVGDGRILTGREKTRLQAIFEKADKVVNADYYDPDGKANKRKRIGRKTLLNLPGLSEADRELVQKAGVVSKTSTADEQAAANKAKVKRFQQAIANATTRTERRKLQKQLATLTGGKGFSGQKNVKLGKYDPTQDQLAAKAGKQHAREQAVIAKAQQKAADAKRKGQIKALDTKLKRLAKNDIFEYGKQIDEALRRVDAGDVGLLDVPEIAAAHAGRQAGMPSRHQMAEDQEIERIGLELQQLDGEDYDGDLANVYRAWLDMAPKANKKHVDAIWLKAVHKFLGPEKMNEWLTRAEDHGEHKDYALGNAKLGERRQSQVAAQGAQAGAKAASAHSAAKVATKQQKKPSPLPGAADPLGKPRDENMGAPVPKHDAGGQAGSSYLRLDSSGKPGNKALTPDQARVFLELANGDRDAARELARQQGYSF